MKLRTASVVTIDDLQKYFTGHEKKWKAKIGKDGLFEAFSPITHYNLEFNPKNTLFHVHIEAIDDPQDSYDVTTDEPIRAMAKFLGEGLPGGEKFEQMVAFGPNEFESILIYVASQFNPHIHKQQLGNKLLRRAAIIPDADFLLRVVDIGQNYVVSQIAGRRFGTIREIPALKQELHKKGWKVSERKNDVGIPVLDIDISGIYSATIIVDSIQYEYRLEVDGDEGSVETGMTTDPIDTYEKWTGHSNVKDARRKYDEERANTIPYDGPSSTSRPKTNNDGVTVNPKRASFNNASMRTTRKSSL